MTLLLLQPLAQAPKWNERALDQRLEVLKKAKDWTAMNALFETLPPRQRESYSNLWMQALEREGNWARLLEVAEAEGRLAKGKPDPFVTHYRGRALIGLGRRPEALAWFLDHGKLGDPTAYLEASAEAVVLADWPALLICAEALLAKAPLNGDYLGMKGEALTKLGRYPEAETVLTEAVALAPQRAMSWADLACCGNELTRYPEALAAAERAVALTPNLLEGWYNLGRACMGLKRYQAGRDAYAQALALRPADPALVKNLKANLAAADAYLASLRAVPNPRPGKKP